MQEVDLPRVKVLIVTALTAVGRSARSVSLEAGLGPDTLGKFLKGEIASPRADNLARVLAILGIPQDAISGGDDVQFTHSPTLQQSFGVRFGGIAAAGVWRQHDDMSQTDDFKTIPIPHDARYPRSSQYAFRVEGDSMTEAGIFEGMYALAVDIDTWERLHGGPRDGKLVVVARTRNGNPERELTVKQLRIFRDRYELHPRSSNPTWRPSVFPLPPHEDDVVEAQIIAVVLSATRLY